MPHVLAWDIETLPDLRGFAAAAGLDRKATTKSAARFAPDDTARAKLDKLDAVIKQSFASSQDAALFAEILSLPNDNRHPTLEMTSQP